MSALTLARRLGTGSELKLILGRFLFRLGGEATYFIGLLGYAAYVLDATVGQIALLMAAAYGVEMVSLMVGGWIVDRIGPKRTILTWAPLLAAFSVGMQFVGARWIPFIAVSMFVMFSRDIVFSGFSAFPPYLVEGKPALKSLNSRVESISYAATIAGPLIGAYLAANFAIARVFLFAATLTLASMAVMYFARERRTPERDEDVKHPAHAFSEGAKLVFSTTRLRYYLAVGILAWFAFGAFDALEPAFLKDIAGFGVEWMGYVNASIGVGLVIGALLLFVMPARVVNARLLAAVLAVAGVGATLYVVTTSPYVILLGCFVLGVGFGLSEPLQRTLVQAEAPLAAVGRVQSTILTFRIAGGAIPLLISPYLSDLFGVQPVLVGASAVSLLAAFTLVPWAVRLDREGGQRRAIASIDPFADAVEDSIRTRPRSMDAAPDLLVEFEKGRENGS